MSSYAVDAMANSSRTKSSKVDGAESFIERVINAEAEVSESLDRGKDYEIKDKKYSVQGSALVYKKNVVYLGAHQGGNEVLIRDGPTIPLPGPFTPETFFPPRQFPPRGGVILTPPHWPRDERRYR